MRVAVPLWVGTASAVTASVLIDRRCAKVFLDTHVPSSGTSVMNGVQLGHHPRRGALMAPALRASVPARPRTAVRQAESLLGRSACGAEGQLHSSTPIAELHTELLTV